MSFLYQGYSSFISASLAMAPITLYVWTEGRVTKIRHPQRTLQAWSKQQQYPKPKITLPISPLPTIDSPPLYISEPGGTKKGDVFDVFYPTFFPPQAHIRIYQISMASCNSFLPFPSLSIELRMRIWTLNFPGSRLVSLRYTSAISEPSRPEL